MHIKQHVNGSIQLPVRSVKLIIKPEKEYSVGQNKNCSLDPGAVAWNCHGLNIIFVCGVCTRCNLQQVTFQYSHPCRKVRLSRCPQFFLKNARRVAWNKFRSKDPQILGAPHKIWSPGRPGARDLYTSAFKYSRCFWVLAPPPPPPTPMAVPYFPSPFQVLLIRRTSLVFT